MSENPFARPALLQSAAMEYRLTKHALMLGEDGIRREFVDGRIGLDEMERMLDVVFRLDR